MTWETIELILLIIATIYLFGALIGGNLALWRIIFHKKKTVDITDQMVHDIKITFMWTIAWPYCYIHWIKQDLRENNK